jgi:very-short-patch-repair endonuclease
MFPGVYAVGTGLTTREATWAAAVLAGGPRALLSHRDACLIRGLLRGSITTIHVTTDERSRHGCRGIHLHRVNELHSADRDRVEGIPVTSVPRTLLDLAATLPTRLAHAIEAADDRRLLHMPDIDDLIERHQGRPGVPALRDALAAYRPDPRFTRSKAEKALVALCRRAGLPLPEMNLNVLGHEVDALWEQRRLIVEIDTYGTHSSRASFERDRRRDAELQLAGYRVLRITDTRLRSEPEVVSALLRSYLSA